jgi:hypothetical protein
VHAQGVARRLVQHQAEVVEAHYGMEPAGQFVEERRQIAVRGDRFRDGQQGSVLVTGGGCLSVKGRACHGETWSVNRPKPANGALAPPGARGRLPVENFTAFQGSERRVRLLGRSWRASVRHTSARIAIPPTCSGRI